MKDAILLDFGSTYTKVVCVDTETQNVLLTEKFPSTVHTDAGIALNQCFAAAKNRIGGLRFEKALKLSSSSAAGGLRIAVSGLTESLSIEAGRNASFGAGGKIVYTAHGIVTDTDISGIELSGAEILLVCGGYEGGNTELVLRNVKKISESTLNIPIIYAGNSALAKNVRMLCSGHGKECFVAENMMPGIGLLNIAPTVEIIRNLFMTRITNMKGVGTVKRYLDAPIVPTPAAVLEAGKLLYNGTENIDGIGPFMMVDIGGATTDVYSFVKDCAFNGAKQIGLPEPDAKRTVEGDMGMRESSINLLHETGMDILAERCNLSTSDMEAAIERRITCHEYVADCDIERKIDFEIACEAIKISSRRHAGILSRELCDGHKLVQRGKNLSDIKTVIGTGGILVNNDQSNAHKILANANKSPADTKMWLLPNDAETKLDRDYIMFAAGLLSQYDEECAMKIMKLSIGLR